MKAISAAIMTRFTALSGGLHNSFYNAIGGRLYKGRAPQGVAVFPYSIFFVVSNAPERTFSEDYRSAIIQFSHFSSAQSSGEAEDINQYCNDLFNEQPLTVTGASTVWMRMTDSPGAQPEDNPTTEGTSQVWHCPTDYELRLSLT